MASNEQLTSFDKDPEKVDERLKENLKVNFRLESSIFPDNKIFGTIDIEPEWAWKLIKQFTFILNQSQEFPFNPVCRTISASGFNPRDKDFSAAIKAKFVTDSWTKEVKSKSRTFHFSDHVYAFSPIVTFDWSRPTKEEKRKPTLVVKWHHIDSKKAHEYVLYLNDKKIYQIRHQLIRNSFDIRIENLICGRRYILQIAATLISGKETCRSDPIKFTMPTEPKDHAKGIITVLSAPIPIALPIINEQNQKKSSEKEGAEIESDQFRLKAKNLLIKLTLQTESGINHCQTSCCRDLPHKVFPGIPHYFADGVHTIEKSSTSSIQKKTTYSISARKTTPMNNDKYRKEVSAKDKWSANSNTKTTSITVHEQEKENDDDDDVVHVILDTNENI